MLPYILMSLSGDFLIENMILVIFVFVIEPFFARRRKRLNIEYRSLSIYGLEIGFESGLCYFLIFEEGRSRTSLNDAPECAFQAVVQAIRFVDTGKAVDSDRGG